MNNIGITNKKQNTTFNFYGKVIIPFNPQNALAWKLEGIAEVL